MVVDSSSRSWNTALLKRRYLCLQKFFLMLHP
jgi:hypothetical protein